MPTTACAWRSTPPRPARPHSRRWTCWPAGRQPPTRPRHACAAGSASARHLGRRGPTPQRPLTPDTTREDRRTMTSATTPALTLNNSVTIPALGLGVFQSPPEETTAAVETALRDGYRLIDTAAAYGNEREVGDAVRASGLDRSEVFLETKIWITDYG